MLTRPLLPVALALACGAIESPGAGSYFPGKDWRESTPEAQGLDSAVLARLVADISEKKLNVHSVMVIRHGYVVMDAYFYPYRPNTPHDVASVTKSISSAVVGIAADKGLLSTDRRVLSFFPDEAPKHPEPSKKQITIENLLTMEPGMDCGFKPGEQELEAMRHTDDWGRYALAIPMINPPGTKFGYCSPGFHLLSSIVTAVTHEPEADFARKNLFDPIGVGEVVWPPDPQGRTHGWGDSHFLPRDMARIGYLYLHAGNWNGRQVISRNWVEASTAVHANTGRPGVDYGYGWWIYPDQNPREFSANGRGGQKIAVWPEKDMIIVVTGGGYPPDAVAPVVASAIKSDGALPENTTGNKLLQQKIAAALNAPSPEPAQALPAVATRISGAFYGLPPNPSRLDGIGLTFLTDQQQTALLKFRYLGKDFKTLVALERAAYMIGLGGPSNMPIGARGHWTSDSEFLLDLNFISNINHYTLTMRFEDDSVDIAMNESSGLVRNGHVKGTKE